MAEHQQRRPVSETSRALCQPGAVAVTLPLTSLGQWTRTEPGGAVPLAKESPAAPRADALLTGAAAKGRVLRRNQPRCLKTTCRGRKRLQVHAGLCHGFLLELQNVVLGKCGNLYQNLVCLLIRYLTLDASLWVSEWDWVDLRCWHSRSENWGHWGFGS